MAKKVKEGRKLKSLPPYNKISPYIMVLRNDAQNFIRDSINVDKAEEYIRKKRAEGLKGFGMLHLLVASYVRTVSQRPGINRFIRGQRVHARNCIEVMLTIKKETGSRKWTLLAVLLPTAFGAALCALLRLIL